MQCFEDPLHRYAALGQEMVFVDADEMPRIVPAREALKEYEMQTYK